MNRNVKHDEKTVERNGDLSTWTSSWAAFMLVSRSSSAGAEDWVGLARWPTLRARVLVTLENTLFGLLSLASLAVRTF